MLDTIQEHIDITLGVCGGKPRIAGHRIRVQDVAVLHERRGLTPDEIIQTYPNLTLSDVHAALAYYFDHREQVEKDLAADAQLAEEVRQATPSRLMARPRRTAGKALKKAAAQNPMSPEQVRAALKQLQRDRERSDRP